MSPLSIVSCPCAPPCCSAQANGVGPPGHVNRSRGHGKAEFQPRWKPLAAELPDGEGWQFEPKWDGFRCLARREGDEVTLTSKSGKPLARYFPEVVDMLRGLKAKRFLLDGELIIPVGTRCPSTRCSSGCTRRRAACASCRSETPAELMAFDLLELGGKSLVDLPLWKRREELEEFFERTGARGLQLSPDDPRPRRRVGWLHRSGGALDGVIAKRADHEYRSGERAMIKVKQQRTADCVVGGFRYAEKKREVGSLLLGLYDDEGQLDHVGFTSAIPGQGAAGADQEARGADRAARLHRQRARRPEPLEHRALDGSGSR